MADSSDESGKVIHLPLSDNWSPEQALAAAGQMVWEDITIVGHNEKGERIIINSRMDLRDQLLIAEELRMFALGIG